ncbi:MAG: response regulator [Desulfovibrionaceae bacterium]
MTDATSIRILLVEDSGMVRTMVTNQLKAAGYTNVTTARDGQDAIAQLRHKGAPDVILCDWNMPNMNGYDFLLWLRADPTFKNVPFFMVTAQSDKRQTARALEAGAHGLLPKPFSAEELTAKLKQVLGGGRDTMDTPTGRRVMEYAPDGRVRLAVAYTQSIDHLTLGALQHCIEQGIETPRTFELAPRYMESWNEVQDAIEHERVDGAYLLPPMAMDLFGYGVPLRLVLLGGRGGGHFVSNRVWAGVKWASAKEYFMYKVVCIPHKMSLENMLAHKYLTEQGLRPGVPGTRLINVRFEVVPPIKMPQFMALHENVAGFVSADPIASMAVVSEIAQPMIHTSSLWPNHPAGVLVMRDECVEGCPEVVQELVAMLVRAGGWIMDNPDEAAEMAVAFLDPHRRLRLNAPVMKKALTDPQGISFADLTPAVADLDAIQRYMAEHMDTGEPVDMDRLVDTTFAMDAHEN